MTLIRNIHRHVPVLDIDVNLSPLDLQVSQEAPASQGLQVAPVCLLDVKCLSSHLHI